jgi:hypothetical protein
MAKEILENDEVKQLKIIEEVLEHLNGFTTDLMTSKYPTFGCPYFDVPLIINALIEIRQIDGDVETLITGMQFRWDKERKPVLQLASFLDPRCNDWKKNDQEFTEFFNKLLKGLIELARETSGYTDQIQKKEQPLKKSLTGYSWLKSREEKKAIEIESGSAKTEVTMADEEISSFRREPELDRMENPFEWWRKKCRQYPSLAILAKKILFVPATSASVERLFSMLRSMIDNSRYALAASFVNDLTFAKAFRKLQEKE